MKKVIDKIFILLLSILIIIGTNVYAATPTLEQIVNAFNNCSAVKEYETHGSIWKASSNGNKLSISITSDGETSNFDYKLEGSILNANFSANDAFTGAIVTMFLTDAIGQLHGYSDGELLTTLNSDKVSSYSIENEGFEVKKLTDGSGQIKIDISKKIPLIDVSNVYIEVSDLENLKKYISGDGSAEKSKGNIWFNKSGYNGKNTLLIAEEGKLTENTYKSILSIIEVMFNSSKATDYFKSNYSGISVGNKEFTGFKIEINPTKTEFEESLIPSNSNYKFARITIDKDSVNSSISVNNNNTENKITDTNKNTDKDKEQNKQEKYSDVQNSNQKSTNKNNTDNSAKGKLPKAGINMNSILAIITIATISFVFYKKYNNYKDIN